jgi:hypothetical protein
MASPKLATKPYVQSLPDPDEPTAAGLHLYAMTLLSPNRSYANSGEAWLLLGCRRDAFPSGQLCVHQQKIRVVVDCGVAQQARTMANRARTHEPIVRVCCFSDRVELPTVPVRAMYNWTAPTLKEASTKRLQALLSCNELARAPDRSTS